VLLAKTCTAWETPCFAAHFVVSVIPSAAETFSPVLNVEN